MLKELSGVRVYLACGYTDLRGGIDKLAGLVQQRYELDSFSRSLYLFCGRRRDRIKGSRPRATSEKTTGTPRRLSFAV